MATVLKTKFQLRRGNAEVWARNNPVLERGEPGFEIDTGRLKIGNGQTAWNDLEYLAPQSGAGGGVQPDWNQNDNTQPDYVKNRPFYSGDPVETVLVEESAVAFAENDGVYVGNFQSTVEVTVGETYKVSWDGTAYECTCVSTNVMPVIGNPSITGVGSDTGEPFVMAINNGSVFEICTADTSASHTISISHYFSGEVVKIDRKYLPKAAFITYDSSTSTYSSDFTNDELYERMLEGEQIVLYFPTDNEMLYLTSWKKQSDGQVDLSFGANDHFVSLLTDGTIAKTTLS